MAVHVPSGWSRWPPAVAFCLLFLPLLPLLVWVPTLVPGGTEVPSAASVEGYNNSAAYQVVVLWLAVVFAVAWRVLRGAAPAPPPARLTAGIPAARRWLERLAVAAAVVVALWPWALAPHGSYVEDSIFLNAAHRMLSGLTPYKDFEFLYGPFMVVPLARWMSAAGFSLENYYVYLLATELLGWLAVAIFLQRVVPEGRQRLMLFALAVSLLLNPLLGLNYTGLRRLIPMAALLVLTRAPTALGTAAVAGALLGVGLAYSHDTATAAGLAAGAMYLVVGWIDGRTGLWRSMLAFGAAAVAVWLALAMVLLGGAFGDYLRETRTLVARFSAGEAAFRFYWTVNALALFGVVVAAVAVVARGFSGRTPAQPTAWGDRWIVAALVATIVQLKSGLNRADIWHLGGCVLPLVTAMAVPLPRTIVWWSRSEHRAILGALAVLGATNLIGQAPVASYAARGWLAGWSVPRAATTVDVATVAPALELQRTSPDPVLLEVARYFAEPSRRGQPVYFYGTLWGIGPRIGVPKRDPNNDDFIYGDDRGERVRRWLDSGKVPYVLMSREAEARLFGHVDADPLVEFQRRVAPSLMKSLGAWTSSVHYHGLEVEMPLQDARWRRLIGESIRADYARDAVIGGFVVLRRTSR